MPEGQRYLSRRLPSGLLMACLMFCPVAASAAELDGSRLGAWWGLPFAALLLAIAFLPLLAPRFWHRHFGKVALACALAFLLPCILVFGAAAALAAGMHALVAEFFPFIILITALYVVAGGICIRGNLHGTPAVNTGLLAIGTVLASLMGTTGAAMLMIRPLMRANDNRRHTTHLVVFFIFLVANAGGALTPLGDPPLFLGFLQGVDFFWTLQNILPETLFLCGALLAIFYAVDYWHYHHREEERPAAIDPTPDSPLRFEGRANFILLAAIVALVLMSGLWKSGLVIALPGVQVDLQSLLRDAGLLAVTGISLWITPRSAREGNDFHWGPIQEVGKLFAGIFITIVPVIAMLKAGAAGVFAPVLRAVTDSHGQPLNSMYFWATGLLSAFLDNAPTYLVFFNAAGGNPATLMGSLAATLAAISCGAVFMGAMTYIGNAPNMMVRAIAEQGGIRMPSFFGFMLWSGGILLPLFVLMTIIFFR